MGLSNIGLQGLQGSELKSNILSDDLLRVNKTGAFMKTKPHNNDLGGRTPLN